MSYNSVLDFFFSNFFVYIGVLIVILAGIRLLKPRYIYSSFFRGVYGMSYWVISFFWIITFFLLNPAYIGYGNPNGITALAVDGERLYVLDYLLTKGDETSDPDECSRVHVLDAETGKKSHRFLIGEKAKLTGIKGDSLIFHVYDMLSIYSVSKGKPIVKMKRKNLPEIFPELESGINSVSISYSENVLELTTLNGNHYLLSMKDASLKPVTKDRYAFVKNDRMVIHNESEIRTNEVPAGRTIIELRPDDKKPETRLLKNRSGAVINDEGFLMGKFAGLSEELKCFAVLSYETIDKKGFILTGMTLDGKTKLWEMRESSLRKDGIDKYELPVAWTQNEKSDILYFGMKDEVLAIEMLTGKILWREKL